MERSKKIGNDYYTLASNGAPRKGTIKLKAGSTTYEYYFQPASKEGDIPGKLFYGGWTYVVNSKGEKTFHLLQPEDSYTWTDHETWCLCIYGNVQEISVHAEFQWLCNEEYNGEG